MNRKYIDAHYTTLTVNDVKKGFSAIELYCFRKGNNDRVAKVVYWDASGQFFFETFNTDIPLDIVEDLIAEAKSVIRVA